MHILQDSGDALQAHAGIDARTWQWGHHPLLVAIELHEDEIPDLDVAVTIGLGRTGRTTRHVGPVVVEDFGTWTAGAGIGHLPEVVTLVGHATGLVADAHAALGWHADLAGPYVVGLVVFVVDGSPQAFDRNAVDSGQQFPGKMDGFAFEIIPERKVAEHLEKRMMARGVADVFQIVVLATCPYAALSRRGPPVTPYLLAEKYLLELHHARVGEQKRRIIARHE